MDSFVQDLKYSLRSFLRRPGFAVAVTLTLGLGIAANTAIFSVVSAVLLNPMPFEQSENIVSANVMSTRGFYISTSIPNYYDWKDEARSWDSFGAYRGTSMVMTGLDRPEVINTRQVLGDFFRVLRVEAQMGRVILSEETEPGAASIAVVTHAFWQGRLGGDPQVLGRTISLDGMPFEIVGVMPEGFAFPSATDEIYTPMGFFSENMAWNVRGSSSGTRTIGRLAEGVTLQQAQLDLDRIVANIRADGDPQAAAPELVTLAELYVGDVRTPIWVLMGAVGFVLLIACANVANLLLVRGEGRQHEIALRTALGADRGRVIRQLLTESLVLGALGGVVGIGLAWLAVGGMTASLPDSIPSILRANIGIDSSVLGFTFALSLISGLFFGLAPAIRAARPNLVSSLKEGGRGGHGTRGGRLRSGLVIAEVGLSLILLMGAGLLIKSLDALHAVDKGFDESGVLTMRIPLPDSKYDERELWTRFYEDLMERIRALPGVQYVSVSNLFPLSGSNWETSITPDGLDPADPENGSSVLWTMATEEYFDALGIEILQGRAFDATDDMNSPMVVVIDDTMAETFWPGEDPLGRLVTMETTAPDAEGNTKPLWREVVGVAKHVRNYTLQEPSRIEAYLPLQQTRVWGFAAFLEVKSAGDLAVLVNAIREQVRSIDPDQPVQMVRPMTEVIDAQLATSNAMRGLMVIFGALALLLAAIGIYGVMSYSVEQRVREIGIRMALGADAAQVRWLVSSEGFKLAVFGLGLGAVGALGMGRALQSQLFGVESVEPLTLGAASAILVAVATFAAYLPARRATRVDPAVVLRQD